MVPLVFGLRAEHLFLSKIVKEDLTTVLSQGERRPYKATLGSEVLGLSSTRTTSVLCGKTACSVSLKTWFSHLKIGNHKHRR